MTSTLVRLVAVREGARCSLCHDGLTRSSAACAGCGARLHRACWSSLRGACPTLGCGGVGPLAGPRPALLLPAATLAWTLGALALHACDLVPAPGLVQVALLLITAPAWVALIAAALLRLARRPLSALAWSCLGALLVAPTTIQAVGPSVAARAVLAWHRADWEAVAADALAAGALGPVDAAAHPDVVVLEPGLVWFHLAPGVLGGDRSGDRGADGRAFVRAPRLPAEEVASGRFFGPRATWEHLGDGWWFVDTRG